MAPGLITSVRLDKVTKFKFESQTSEQINNLPINYIFAKAVSIFRASSQFVIALKVLSPTPLRYCMVGWSSIVSFLDIFLKVTVCFTATTSVLHPGKFGSFLSGTLGQKRYQNWITSLTSNSPSVVNSG